MKNNDKYFMKLAIKEAKKAGNDVFPNPKVGCLIVKDGKVVSKGFHKRFGGRHAEQVAIDNLPQNIKKTTPPPPLGGVGTYKIVKIFWSPTSGCQLQRRSDNSSVLFFRIACKKGVLIFTSQ